MKRLHTWHLLEWCHCLKERSSRPELRRLVHAAPVTGLSDYFPVDIFYSSLDPDTPRTPGASQIAACCLLSASASPCTDRVRARCQLRMCLFSWAVKLYADSCPHIWPFSPSSLGASIPFYSPPLSLQPAWASVFSAAEHTPHGQSVGNRFAFKVKKKKCFGHQVDQG